jgi:hypothetical protein
LSLAGIESVPSLRHHWVAVDTSGRPRSERTRLRLALASGAVVVDADEELDVLCRRISADRRTSLTIVYAA